jgi:hypothetical protein
MLKLETGNWKPENGNRRQEAQDAQSGSAKKRKPEAL